MTNYSGSWQRLLATLDFVEKLASSNLWSCAGCLFYWEDNQVEPRAWGYCRRNLDRSPGGEEIPPYDSPAIDYNWFCGGFVEGPHPAIMAQRAVWRQQLERARDAK